MIQFSNLPYFSSIINRLSEKGIFSLFLFSNFATLTKVINKTTMLDKLESQNKPLIVLSNSADYPRQKSYAMSELWQQECEQTVITERERPTIKSIRGKLIEKWLTNEELRPQILIQSLIYDEEKYDFTMSKSAGILSKLVADQHQSIIKGKTLKEG